MNLYKGFMLQSSPSIDCFTFFNTCCVRYSDGNCTCCEIDDRDVVVVDVDVPLARGVAALNLVVKVLWPKSTPPIVHRLNTMLFSVSVPVLSQKMY